MKTKLECIPKRVTLKMMSHQLRYVGGRYGHESRGVVFDLEPMSAIYAD